MSNVTKAKMESFKQYMQHKRSCHSESGGVCLQNSKPCAHSNLRTGWHCPYMCMSPCVPQSHVDHPFTTQMLLLYCILQLRVVRKTPWSHSVQINISHTLNPGSWIWGCQTSGCRAQNTPHSNLIFSSVLGLVFLSSCLICAFFFVFDYFLSPRDSFHSCFNSTLI